MFSTVFIVTLEKVLGWSL